MQSRPASLEVDRQNANARYSIKIARVTSGDIFSSPAEICQRKIWAVFRTMNVVEATNVAD